jgi:AhpD family alkylhydroperoxidase
MSGAVFLHSVEAHSAYITEAQKEHSMGSKVQEFHEFRTRMNKRILEVDNRAIKRFFGVDTLTYEPGALDAKTKEMLGLVASMVLRCDDCISYHIEQCRKEGVTDEEMFDVFSVALVVGGSIVIPHLRRGVAFLDELNEAGTVAS